MARVVALDLGSNSFHLALFALQGTACAQLERHKVAVGLGRSVFASGSIDPVQFAAGLAAVRWLSGIAQAMRPEAVLAVATSALREADNGARFLREAERIAGFPLGVIDGAEEARLVGLSASSTSPHRRGVTFDLGGGSLEVAVTHGQRVAFARSLALGTLRSRAGFQAVSGATLRVLRPAVRRELDAPLAQVRRHGFEHASLSCGAARDLLRLANEWLLVHPLGGSEERCLRREHLATLTTRLLALVDAAASARARVSEGRPVESLLVACVVFEELLEGLALDALYVSRASIRHGLALDYFARTRAPLAPTAVAV